MDKNDFSNLLNKQLKKAVGEGAQSERSTVENPDSKQPASQAEEGKGAEVSTQQIRKSSKRAEKPVAGRNTNRATVNLFDADRRALAVIKELLGSAGHDFTSRSDSMKVGLRLAAKAKPDELAKLLDEVRSEDRRFSK